VRDAKNNEVTKIEALRSELLEREKELACLYKFSMLIEKVDVTIDGILQGVVDILPSAMQFSNIACGKVVFREKEYKTCNCVDTKESLRRGITVYGKEEGFICVSYVEKTPKGDLGPFLQEENNLLKAMAERLGRVIERHMASLDLKSTKIDLEKKTNKLLKENIDRKRTETATLNILEDLQETKTNLEENRKQLEAQAWGLKKSNEALKALYGEIESKNKELSKLDQMKTDFVSTVSHELRTPLAITKEGLSLVLDGVTGELNESKRIFLAQAKKTLTAWRG